MTSASGRVGSAKENPAASSRCGTARWDARRNSDCHFVAQRHPDDLLGYDQAGGPVQRPPQLLGEPRIRDGIGGSEVERTGQRRVPQQQGDGSDDVAPCDPAELLIATAEPGARARA